MDLNGPAMPPPPGVKPNFDNPPNENALATGVLTACAVVATLCFFMRAYARVWLLRKVQLEEGLVLCAFGCYWGAIYATFRFIEYPGYFVHQWNVRLKDMIPTTYYIFLFGVFYTIVLPLLKVAILTEWCRMFAPRGYRSEGFFWWGCMAIIFVQVASGIAITVSLNLQCIPHAAIWDFTIQNPDKCFDLYKLQVASASIQLISDVAILLLPQQVIWTLKMSWSKRLGVSVIFGLGLLACISAAFRLSTTITHGRAADAVWTLPPLVFWATAEMTCGFFVVCLPCIPKILKEKGVSKKIARVFGMRGASTTGATDDQRKFKSYGTGNSSVNGSRIAGSTAANAYYKLDNLKSSESTEHLQGDAYNPGIMRTTKITVTEGADTVDRDRNHRMMYP